jgi:hypothetical protein
MRTMAALLLALLLPLAACGGSPADVAGSYTVAVTNGANGCNAPNWTVGNMTAGIPVTIAQDGSNATATIEGLTGTFVMAALGSRVFAGDVGGHSLDLELIGTAPQTSGSSCEFTYNAILDGEIDGDVITGTITYTAVSDDLPDCEAQVGCESVQSFNGTRPPSS